MARKVPEVSAEAAAHTKDIVQAVRGFLEKKKEDKFRIGFRRGAYYLELHTNDFFRQNVDPQKRREAIEFLLNKVYTREEGLFRKLDVSNDYVAGYLQALYALPSLFGKHPAFDPVLLFRGLYDTFKELKVPVWADGPRVELNEKQTKANEAVVNSIREAICSKPTGVMTGYLRSVYYVELHSRFFFEKSDPSKRDPAFRALDDAVVEESRLFAGANKKNEMWNSYVSGLKDLLSLLEDNKDFEPNSLFSGLSALISKSLRADRKTRPD